MSQKINLLSSTAISQTNTNQSVQVGVQGKNTRWIRAFSAILYLVTVLISNILGGSSQKGNKQTADAFHLWVNPPGLFFAIWGVIYTGVAISVIYNLFKNVWNLKTHLYFSLLNIISIAWTLVFDLDTVNSVAIASILLVILTWLVYMTWAQIGNIPTNQINFMTYFIRNVFALYLGWCIAAMNINFGMNIVYFWGGSKKQQMILFWILTPLCAILAIANNVVKQGKFGLKCSLFAFLSVAWAFTGAGISTYNCINGLQDLC